jgi:translation initiation factor eIF-2B subunit beta
LFTTAALIITVEIEHTVGNTVRKVLHHVREEYLTAANGTVATQTTGGPGAFSIAKFVLQGQPRTQLATPKVDANREVLKENDAHDPDSFARALKPVLMEAIQDVLDELETVYESISKNAKDHIHSEYVLDPPYWAYVF